MHLRLWPHRSLTARGFVWFIGVSAVLVALPVTALLGTAALWALLPFPLAAIAGIWWALQRSHRDRAITEDLVIARDRITLTRIGPNGLRAEWSANPHWVSATLHATAGPVPNYLTLRGSAREVELGAFLTEEERIALRAELGAALAALR